MNAKTKSKIKIIPSQHTISRAASAFGRGARAQVDDAA